jgi:hypothetical protein
MKLKTDYTATLPLADATKLLTKFVEKKTGKKVIEASLTSDNGEQAFSFRLQGEESEITEEKPQA